MLLFHKFFSNFKFPKSLKLLQINAYKHKEHHKKIKLIPVPLKKKLEKKFHIVLAHIDGSSGNQYGNDSTWGAGKHWNRRQWGACNFEESGASVPRISDYSKTDQFQNCIFFSPLVDKFPQQKHTDRLRIFQIFRPFQTWGEPKLFICGENRKLRPERKWKFRFSFWISLAEDMEIVLSFTQWKKLHVLL